jgi:NAD(P)-dependent dehydrogenase (short-subunit alcohol dehydrogenase family)
MGTGDEQKVVLITGASQGIGAGLVQGFLDRGYRVVANSRTIKPSGWPDVLTIDGDSGLPVELDRQRARAADPDESVEPQI